MNVLKFLMLLALVLWLGAIVFFAAVVAPVAFAVLPTHHLAGNVVARTLTILHALGISCGVLYLLSSMIYARISRGSAQPLAARHLAVVGMLLLTLVAQFGIARRMQQIRSEFGVIDDLRRDDPRRVHFNRLHVWSTNLEGIILVLGTGVLWGTARRLS